MSESSSWGARVARWWERSPLTNVARVQIPASTPHVCWVRCWFSRFSPRGFSPGGFSRILSDRDDRLGATIKTQKSPGLRLQKEKKKFKNQIPGQKFNPKYPITNFRSNFKKALNDITRKIETLVMESLCLVVIVKTLVTLKNIFCYKHALWTMLLYSRNYAAGISGNYHESSHCFKYPPKILLKSSYPRKYLPKFSYPKKAWNRKFLTPKNPLIIPVTWNPEYPSGDISPGTPKKPPTFPNSNSTRNIW